MRRLRPPDYVAGFGGLVLLAGAIASGGTFGVFDVLLALIALAAIALPVVTMVSDDPAPPIKTDVLVAWAALIAVLITLVRSIGGDDVLALVGALITFAGCWWAMRLQDAPGLRTPPEVRAMPVPPETDPTHPAT